MTRISFPKALLPLFGAAALVLLPAVGFGQPAPAAADEATSGAPAKAAPAKAAPAKAAPAKASGGTPGSKDKPLPGELGLDDRDTQTLFRKTVEGANQIHQAHDNALAAGELTEAGCLGDKAAQADDTVDVASGHRDAALDTEAPPAVRQLGGAGVAAAADNMDNLVKQASNCPGDAEPDEIDDNTDTDLDKEEFVPFQDPTDLDAESPVPAAVGDDIPVAVYSAIF